MRLLNNQVPLTGLRFDGELLYAGVGTQLKVYKWQTGELLGTRQVFAENKIHGIVVTDRFVVVWGGRSFRVLEKTHVLAGDLGNPELKFSDWVVTCAPEFGESPRTVYVLTAHNTLATLDLATGTVVKTAESKVRSILYSGAIYVSEHTTKIAAGTVLDGIVVWTLESNKEPAVRLHGHEGAIFGIAFSPDGEQLASSSDDRSIAIWDLRSGALLSRGWGHGSRIWQLQYTPQYTLVSVSEDLTARHWLVPGPERSEIILKAVYHGHKGRNVWTIAVTEHENVLVAATGGGDGRLQLWNLTAEAANTVVQFPTGDDKEVIRGFASTENATVLTSADGKVAKVSMEYEVFPTHMVSYAVVPMGGKILVASREGEIMLVDTETTDEPIIVETLLTNKLVHAAPFEAEHKYYAILQSQDPREDLLIVDETGSVVSRIESHSRFSVTGVAYTNGNLVIGSRNGSVLVCRDIFKNESNQGKIFNQILGNHDAVTAVLPLGTQVFLGGRTGNVGIFDLLDGGLVARYSNKLSFGSIEGGQRQKNGDLLLFGFRKDLMIVWNATHEYEVATADCGGAHRSWSLRIDHSAEELFGLLYSRAGHVYKAENTVINPFERPMLDSGTHGREIRGVEFSPVDRSLMATTSEDTMVNLATVKNGVVHTVLYLRGHVSGVQALHWTIDGEFLITSAGREELFIWQVTRTPRILARKIAEMPTTTRIPDLRIMNFSTLRVPDSPLYYIACAYSNSTVRIWKFDSVSHEFELMGSCIYRECSILNIDLVMQGTTYCVLMTSTDGHLVIWRVGDSWDLGSPDLRIKLHQSSVRASVVTQNDGMINHYSGGDDNALVGVTVDSNLDTKQIFSVQDAHSSTVTGIALANGDELVSTGADQNIRRWTLDGQLKESVRTAVGDAGGIATDGTSLAVVGSGMAFYTLL